MADFELALPALLLAALLACKGGASDDDRAEVRAKCAKQGDLNVAASDEALAKLRASACSTKMLFESCEDFWDDVVTVCVHDTAEGRRVIDVHANIYSDTSTSRATRNAICDHVRWDVSATDTAFVYGSRGFQMTRCGKARPKPK